MKPLPFARQSGPYEDTGGTGERLVNLYVEQLPDGAATPMVVRTTPGLRLLTEAGTGPVYASAVHSGYSYFISGTTFYRLNGIGGSVDALGSLVGGDETLATIAVGTNHVVVCAPPFAFWMVHAGSSIAKVTDPDLPNVRSVTFLDGFFIFAQYDADRLSVSDLDDPASYDALAFGAIEDRALCVATLNREVWAFGFDKIGIFYNAGTSPYPLARQATGMIEMGCMAPRSVVKIAGALYWLGSDGVVYRAAGFRPERISTHAVERSVLNGGTPFDAIGMTYTQSGHGCYALTRPNAPGGGHTWVFDTVTGMWHEKMSGSAGRWRAESVFQIGATPVAGDRHSGKLLTLEEEDDDEDGTALELLAVLPPVVAPGRERVFMTLLEIDMEVGDPASPPVVRLDWSDDRGGTWSAERQVTVRAAANRRQRVRFTRLGSFRNRTLRIRGTGRANFYGIESDSEAGAS